MVVQMLRPTSIFQKQMLLRSPVHLCNFNHDPRLYSRFKLNSPQTRTDSRTKPSNLAIRGKPKHLKFLETRSQVQYTSPFHAPSYHFVPTEQSVKKKRLRKRYHQDKHKLRSRHRDKNSQRLHLLRLIYANVKMSCFALLHHESGRITRTRFRIKFCSTPM